MSEKRIYRERKVIARFENVEDGLAAEVKEADDGGGFTVVVRNLKTGAAMPVALTFPDREAAIAHAKESV
jgi:hypothetical protein